MSIKRAIGQIVLQQQPVELHVLYTGDTSSIVGVGIQGKGHPYTRIDSNYEISGYDRICLQKNQFVVCSCGRMRSTIEDLRKTELFVDTGIRFCFCDNRWAEVWQIRTSTINLLKEAENDEPRNQDQPEHGSTD
jgi:hypothetical protein